MKSNISFGRNYIYFASGVVSLGFTSQLASKPSECFYVKRIKQRIRLACIIYEPDYYSSFVASLCCGCQARQLR